MQLNESLPVVFNRLLEIYWEIKKCLLSSSNQELKDLIADGCTNCQKSVQMVNELELFSKNETLDDLSSVSLRYLSLPAIIGYFTSQKSDDRLCNLQLAENFYKEFLKLINNYGVPNVPKCKQPSGDNHEAPKSSMANLREVKIKRFKEKKALEKEVENFAAINTSDNIDEEVQRDTGLALVRYWAYVAVEELDLLKEEISILLSVSKQQSPGSPSSLTPSDNMLFRPSTSTRPPLLITSASVRAAVFGAGYPSLPTMTLDQFYALQVKQGLLPPPSKSAADNTVMEYTQRRIDPSSEEAVAMEAKSAETDSLVDKDDLENIAKMRDWDDFKDDNRRGSGNRMNRA